jgi:hypothetical protein
MMHDQIDRLVRRANPLPDPDVLTPVDAPVLTTDRRMEMQTDTREAADGRPQSRWRGPLIGIAAAVAVLIAGSIYLLTNDDSPVATPAPNATRLIGEDVHPVAPGAYFVDTDGSEETATRGTFVIEGNEWLGFDGGVLEDNDGGDIAVSMLVLEVERVSEALCDGGASAPAGTSAKALADQFAAMPGYITLEGLTPVSAFGRDGYHLVLEVPGGCASDDLGGWSSPVFFATDRTYGEGDIVEYWFLDVEGTPVMVEATRWSSLPEGEEVADLTAVLDTLVITP